MIAGPVLIVEKDLDVCNVIEETLTHAGYSVEVLPSGRRALRKAQQKQYSAAILAEQLPDTQGTELLQRIRRHQPHIGGILLAQAANGGRLSAGLEDGVYDIMGTPLNPRRLLNSVNMITSA